MWSGDRQRVLEAGSDPMSASPPRDEDETIRPIDLFNQEMQRFGASHARGQ